MKIQRRSLSKTVYNKTSNTIYTLNKGGEGKERTVIWLITLEHHINDVLSTALSEQVLTESVWKERVQTKQNHVEATMAQKTLYH